MARRRSHLSRSASFRRVVCKWTEVDRNTSRVPVKVAERVNAFLDRPIEGLRAQFTLMPSTCIRSTTSCLNPYCCP